MKLPLLALVSLLWEGPPASHNFASDVYRQTPPVQYLFRYPVI